MINHLDQIMLLREARLKNGIDIIEISNGILHVTLNVSRALDIYQILYKGKNISFISKNGLNNKTGAFADRFEGGMLYTCGFDAIGNVENHMQHGLLHLQGAQIQHMEANEEEIIVTAEITQSALFGSNLSLIRTIRLKKDESRLEIIDSIFNKSSKDDQYIILYHFNFGYPFLNENTVIKIDSKTTEGVTEFAKKNISKCGVFDLPKYHEEQVIYHDGVDLDPIIEGSFAKVKILYNHEMFPYLIEWKSMVSGDYALGIEPSTSKFEKDLHYSLINAKEKKTYSFIIDIYE